ncbi:MAG TPA: TonB family protein [Candidatus Eisenbacteria bacterium]|nr:TonB family protein [Candidatus Eisenbacteria bacterium]
MTLDSPRVPADTFASLQSCLVEGDPLVEKRARRIKRRAVAISVVLQTLALIALILFPLLTKGERLAIKYVTPVPPYAPVGNPHRQPVVQHTPPLHPTTGFFQPVRIGRTIVMRDPVHTHEPEGNNEPSIPDLPSYGDTQGVLGSTTERPAPPPRENPSSVTERHRVSELQQMAQLIRRVEPAYPALAIQTHKEGRVELHAIIATDGTIQSLEVISGDPFFIHSALSAVRQWRYRPTILNGRPIEVDTHITVIYTFNRQ